MKIYFLFIAIAFVIALTISVDCAPQGRETRAAAPADPKSALANAAAAKIDAAKTDATKAIADTIDATKAAAEKAIAEKTAAAKAMAEKAAAAKTAAAKAVAEKAAATKAAIGKGIAEKAAAAKAGMAKAKAANADAKKAIAEKVNATKTAVLQTVAQSADALKAALPAFMKDSVPSVGILMPETLKTLAANSFPNADNGPGAMLNGLGGAGVANPVDSFVKGMSVASSPVTSVLQNIGVPSDGTVPIGNSMGIGAPNLMSGIKESIGSQVAVVGSNIGTLFDNPATKGANAFLATVGAGSVPAGKGPVGEPASLAVPDPLSGIKGALTSQVAGVGSNIGALFNNPATQGVNALLATVGAGSAANDKGPVGEPASIAVPDPISGIKGVLASQVAAGGFNFGSWFGK